MVVLGPVNADEDHRGIRPPARCPSPEPEQAHGALMEQRSTLGASSHQPSALPIHQPGHDLAPGLNLGPADGSAHQLAARSKTLTLPRSLAAHPLADKGRRDAGPLERVAVEAAPPGPLTFACEWPAQQIPPSQAALDAGLILAAAARAPACGPTSAGHEPLCLAGLAATIGLPDSGLVAATRGHGARHRPAGAAAGPHWDPCRAGHRPPTPPASAGVLADVGLVLRKAWRHRRYPGWAVAGDHRAGPVDAATSETGSGVGGGRPTTPRPRARPARQPGDVGDGVTQ